MAARILIVLISVAALVPANALGQESKHLDVEHHEQHTAVWCWAAVTAMVASYVRHERIEDCEVLSRYDKSLGGQGFCCHSSWSQEGDPACVRPGMSGEIELLLGTFFDVPVKLYSRPLTWDEITAQIDADRPMIVRIQGNSSIGHVVVIIGYDTPDQLTIDDPAKGVYVLPYAKLVRNSAYGWTHSWTVGATKPGPSRPRGDVHLVIADATSRPPLGSRPDGVSGDSPEARAGESDEITVVASVPTVQGISKTIVMRALQSTSGREALQALRTCYEKDLDSDDPPPSPATITIGLEMRDGVTTSTWVTDETDLSRNAGSCIAGKVAKWQHVFPSSDGATTQHIRFTFTKPDE